MPQRQEGALGPLGAVTPGSAGAWILTSALRVGLARYVGQAVCDHSLASTSTKAHVVAVGIASLGRVLHCQLLDDAQVSVGLGALWPWDMVGLGGPRISAPPGQEGMPYGGHQGSLAADHSPPPVTESPHTGQASSGQTSP